MGAAAAAAAAGRDEEAARRRGLSARRGGPLPPRDGASTPATASRRSPATASRRWGRRGRRGGGGGGISGVEPSKAVLVSTGGGPGGGSGSSSGGGPGGGSGGRSTRVGDHLAAGACSAVVSRTLVAPLERVKMEMMVGVHSATLRRRGLLRSLRALLARGGVSELWAGNGTNLMRVVPFRAVNFCTFDMLKRALDSGLLGGSQADTIGLGSDGGDGPHASRFLAGAGAGVVATLVCFPLDTVRTLLLSQAGGARLGPLALAATAQEVVCAHGVGRLYRGIKPAMISQAPSSALFYGTYDLLKTNTLRRRSASDADEEPMLTAAESLLFGGMAGMVSEACCFPLEVLRRRMQVSGGKVGVTALVRGILREGGLRSLYGGVLPAVLQVIPNAAMGYFTYERTLYWISHRRTAD